ncbi:MAG: CvpA family protein [Phycisphaerales bacterium]|nr:MAG: CvpA family protein [Phycisphaerales bacterium]
MVFWLGILVGGLFAWLAVRIGFYETWALLINIVAAVYVAIFSAQPAMDFVPGAGAIRCGSALMLVAIAGGTFLILHGISYTFLTGQFKVSFPQVFDIVFAGVLGFFGGFLVLSFMAFVLSITPIAQNKYIRQMGFGRESQQSNMSAMCWVCDKVSGVVSSESYRVRCEQILDELASRAQPKEPPGAIEQYEPNSPATSDDGMPPAATARAAPP